MPGAELPLQLEGDGCTFTMGRGLRTEVQLYWPGFDYLREVGKFQTAI